MEKRGVRVLVGHLTTCASAAGACGAAARPQAENTPAAAPRLRPGQQQARVRQHLVMRTSQGPVAGAWQRTLPALVVTVRAGFPLEVGRCRVRCDRSTGPWVSRPD